MKRLEVSGAVQSLEGSLGFKGLNAVSPNYKTEGMRQEKLCVDRKFMLMNSALCAHDISIQTS
jgi:hypothetical protein